MSISHLFFSRHLGVVLMAVAASAGSASAQSTYFWNKPNSATPLTWSNSSNANWTTTSTGTVYTAWPGSVNSADIVTTNATINMGGSAVTTAGLTVENGLALGGASASASTGLVISGTSGASGSGNFSLVDNIAFTNSFLVRFSSVNTADTGYNGTITVNALSSAAQGTPDSGYTSGLVLGSDTYAGASPSAYFGTGVNTKIALNGGNLLLGKGLAYTAAATTQPAATIGELSGTGTIGYQSIASSTGGTRNLTINQASTTIFSGAIGNTTNTQVNNVVSLTKSGAGKLTITASAGSAYSGLTSVNGGTLNINGTLGSASAGGTNVNQGGFGVASGANLGLSGTINAAAASAITIASGGSFSPGALTFTSPLASTSLGLVLGGNTTLNFTLGTTQSLLTFGNNSMIGSSTGGIGSINLAFTDSGDTAIATTYNLINFGGTSIGIPAANFAVLSNGFTGSLGYFGLNGADANTLQYTVSSVPEPSTVVLPT